MGSMRTPEPGALPSGYNARHRATQTQLPTRTSQMLLSVQMWTPGSRLLREKKAPLLVDRESVDPGCSSCEFPGYAAPSQQDRWERQDRGYSRASAVAHPKHI